MTFFGGRSLAVALERPFTGAYLALEHFPISLHHILRRRSSLRIHGVSRSG